MGQDEARTTSRPRALARPRTHCRPSDATVRGSLSWPEGFTRAHPFLQQARTGECVQPPPESIAMTRSTIFCIAALWGLALHAPAQAQAQPAVRGVTASAACPALLNKEFPRLQDEKPQN